MIGHDSGLRVNLLKIMALSIRSTDDDMRMVIRILGCPAGTFLCRFSSLVDQLAACLPTWRASSLPKSERLLLV